MIPRQDAEEWIDQPDTPTEHIRETLRDQAWVNQWLGGASAILTHARPVLRACTSEPLRVLDLACGGADISRRIADEARRLGKQVDIIALDRSERVIHHAQVACSSYHEISFVHADALFPPLANASFDLIILATCLHHLPPDEALRLLQAARELSRGTVIAVDLMRSRLASGAFGLIARLLRFHPVSTHDGAVSVRRAYTPPELSALARRARLDDFSLYRHPFYRMALVYQQRSDSHD